MSDILSQDIQYLKGVGPARAKLLNSELDVYTLKDLLYTFPYKYVDRTIIHRIQDLEEDMPQVQLVGQIVDFERVTKGPHKRIVATFTDGTGYIELVWFKALKYINETIKANVPYLILGKPTVFGRRFSIAHPEIEKYGEESTRQNQFQAFYSTTELLKKRNISSKVISHLISNAFDAVQGKLAETLSPSIINEKGLLSLEKALYDVHYPNSSKSLPPALHRLKFEELFYLQLDILHYAKDRKKEVAGFLFKKVGEQFLTFYNDHLPFELTEAQKRVIKEIRSDMRKGQQMNRLLQGDVGSGKTMVALMSCLLAIDNGFQACIMAPTEILAEQHLATVRELLGNMNVNVELLTGIVKGKERKRILDDLASGKTQILVGTHALIEPKVHFLNLGLAVIDEQHRFGVKQRSKLWEKNIRPPHVLVMTATPIPRTLAMTVYGDLDVSVIDELPPGRKPIQTLHYYSSDVDKMYAGIRTELKRGRQVYIVYPLIEESEKSDLKNLEDGYMQLTEVFSEYNVGKVHGKMKSQEKEAAMSAFLNNEIQILVSTTVIEVGVNVPNASVMVIEEADRFGLAQLHQLRGRVGRGAEQSYCILMTHRRLNENTKRRMDIMVESNDGFVIAEEDMKLRGPGDLEGTAQSGLPFTLKIANIIKDNKLMEEARECATRIMASDPDENLSDNAIVWKQLKRLKRNKENFSDIS